MNQAERARRRVLIFALAIAAGFGALAVATWWTGRVNLREGSKVISPTGSPLEVTEVPTSYRAVFRVENRAGPELSVTTERMWVKRPFHSRRETYRGPPPGDERLSLLQSAFGILASTSSGTEPLNIAAPPSLSAGDLRVDVVIEEAVENKTILRRERREVYGRECQVYRAGGPVFAGDLTTYVGGRGEFVDFCVDDNGLVIEEAWTRDNRFIHRRVAVEVEINPAIDRDLFDIDVPENPDIKRGLVERIDPKTFEGDLNGSWAFPDVPDGFDDLGQYAVQIPPDAVPRLNELAPPASPTSLTDVFVRDADLLVIDQDPSLATAVASEGRQERDIDLPNLEDARLIFDARMSEVRGLSPDGSVVRLFGTLAPSELVRLARSLEQVGGSGE